MMTQNEKEKMREEVAEAMDNVSADLRNKIYSELNEKVKRGDISDPQTPYELADVLEPLLRGHGSYGLLGVGEELVLGPGKRGVIEVTNIGGKSISTTCLGINYNDDPDGPPILYETMVFDEPYRDIYQERYSTEEEARRGHASIVQMVEKGEI